MIKFYLSYSKYLTVLLLCGALSGFAQQKTVTGKVTASDDGSVMPGVNILEKGTTNGTVTDTNGEFKIEVGASSTLAFSFVGYATREVAVGDQTVINIVLETDAKSLAEVVVVGYGQQEKKDVTGSITAVSSKDFNKGIISSPQDMLIGKVAGVQITTNSGAPGSGSTIRIRGNGSVNGSQDPLIVIDGYPVDNTGPNGVTGAISGLANPLATLNPNDIETFTVLKDASATAIYGLRASNGVIIITTKKGKSGKPQISYNVNLSASTPMKYYDVLSGDQVRSLAASQVGILPGLNPASLSVLGKENTDWQKQIYQTAISQDHNISVAGSAKNFPYRVSYGYTDQEGILKSTNFVRNSLNVNLTPTFLDGDLAVTATMKGMYTKQNFGNTGAVGGAVAYDPTQPVYNGNTAWGGYSTWMIDQTQINGSPNTNATSNPVAQINQTDNQSSVYRGIGSIKLDYRLRFFPAIKLTVNAGMDYATTKGHNNYSNNAAWTFPALGQLLDYTAVSKSRLLDLYANYSKLIDKHKLDVTVGYSYQAFDRDGSNFQRNGAQTIFTNSQLNADGTHSPQPLVSNPNVLLSFFGRLNYSFNDKYMLTLSFRDDASSRFAKENWFTIFPAVGGAWRINKESFMQGSKLFSELKLRGSYGVTGQQDVANNAYPYLSTYQISNSTAQYQFGNTFINTARPQAYDKNLRWETTAQTDIGVDFGILQDRITGTVDYFQKETSNLIVTVPVAAGSNFSNFVTTNVGNLENKGYEITLRGVAVKKQDLEWDIGFNFYHYENKITKLIASNDPNFTIPYGGIGLSKYIQTIQVGAPIYSYSVLQQVYDTKGNPIEGTYVDRSGQGGNPASNTANFFNYHKPQPDYLMGINSRVNYKKWDFYFQGRVSLGNYNYNAVAASAYYANLHYSTGYFNNLPSSINDTKFSSIQSYSSYYVQNASFFKMDNISLGYSFDQLFTQKLKARLSFTVQNAFWISKYKGIDPEVDGGIDNNIYPRPRVFLLGFNVTY